METKEMRHRGVRILALALLGGLGCGDFETGDADVLAFLLTRGSVARNAAQSNGASARPHLSPNGRYVVFSSQATNLLEGDSNGNQDDVFLRDRGADTVDLISVDDDGMQQVLATGITETSRNQFVSEDGRYVAFESRVRRLDSTVDLTDADQSQSPRRVFVRDRLTGKTRMASRTKIVANAGFPTGQGMWLNSSSGSQCTLGGISRDGRWVVFNTNYDVLNAQPFASTRQNIFVTDMQAVFQNPSTTNPPTYLVTHQAGAPTTAADDGDSGTVSDPTYSGPSVSITVSGATILVVFNSGSKQLIAGYDVLATIDQIFLWSGATSDPAAGTIQLISQAASAAPLNGACWTPAISGDGRYVAYATNGSDLIGGASSTNKNTIVVRDRNLALGSAGATRVVSIPSGKAIADMSGHSSTPRVSDDGRYVTFASDATVLGAVAGFAQIHVRDMSAGISLISQSSFGVRGNNKSQYPGISSDGATIAFESVATNLVVSDTNGYTDIFVRGPSK